MSNAGIFPRCMISVLLLMLPALLSAGIYSWTDENGKIHFGDRPPVAHKADIVTVRVNTYSADSRTVSGEKVVLYTTQRCGYCKKAKQFLRQNNVSYTEYDIETSTKGRRDYKKLNGTGVPIILIGDRRMDGFSEGRMASMLKSAGY